jgi:hypothetical protein
MYIHKLRIDLTSVDPQEIMNYTILEKYQNKLDKINDIETMEHFITELDDLKQYGPNIISYSK